MECRATVIGLLIYIDKIQAEEIVENMEVTTDCCEMKRREATRPAGSWVCFVLYEELYHSQMSLQNGEM
jgi:hypothetical protein